MQRTLALETVGKVGGEVVLQGWVNSKRAHGKIVFLDLRDRSGVVQVVVNKEAGRVGVEDVVEIVGKVQMRPEALVNPKLETGTVEVSGSEVKLLNPAGELPFAIDTDGYDLNEEIRLKYRYLDLRRNRMQKIMRLRSKFVRALREALYGEDFVEVETPLLTKSTKEGARDFLVPSRFQPGKFYALPQSPQQYKQLLMSAGVERYFQIAKCMRDEDLRADRGFEFTQLDVEMSFVTQKQVMETIEEVVKGAVKSVGGRLKSENFPIVDYKDALSTYGADKFDLRTEEEKKAGVLAFAWVVNFPFFKRVDTSDAAEVMDGKSGWTFTHNPFSTPIPEHVDWHLKGENIDKIVTAQYDLVCNGYEAGGGSIRAHRPDVLNSTMKIMGYSDEQIEASIGHMLTAFKLGTPPHGGIALGLDRLVMLLTGESSVKEAIAFPMTSTGRTAIMDAPSEVEEKQLTDLGLKLTNHKLKDGEEVYTRIIELLEEKQIEYRVHEHAAVKTSEEAAAVRGTPLSWGAKALVMIADGKPIMVVVPGDKKADQKKIKATFKIKDLRMATPEEVTRVTGVIIGAVPPFGNIFEIPLYMELSIRKNDSVVFNAGLHTKSVEMSEKDYEKVAQPIVAEFCKE